MSQDADALGRDEEASDQGEGVRSLSPAEALGR